MSSFLFIAVSVPLFAAFIGWITNWLALIMIFHPEKFVGIGPLGWQGVLPRRATRFATDAAVMITTRLISPREMAEKLDPEEMEALFEKALDEETEPLVAETAELVRPGAWASLDPQVRAMIVEQVRREARSVARHLFDRLQGLSDEILDLKALIVSSLSGQNTRRLVRLFKEIGAKELRFIEYYGGVFGFLIGLLQAGLFGLFSVGWTMPIVGLVVGVVTNWLAIQMIFRPQEPRRFFGLVTYQGMFPRRQAEIARDYGRIAADEILTPRNLLRLVTEGTGGERIARLIGESVSDKIEAEYAKVAAMGPISVSPEVLEEVKRRVTRRIVEKIPEVQPELEAYLQRKLEIAKTIENKLASLPKPEFERVLRGLFEQDETILIAIGGVLGFAVGVAQGLFTLAQSGR